MKALTLMSIERNILRGFFMTVADNVEVPRAVGEEDTFVED